MKHVVFIFFTIFGCVQLAQAAQQSKPTKRARMANQLSAIPESEILKIKQPSEEMGSFDPEVLKEVLKLNMQESPTSKSPEPASFRVSPFSFSFRPAAESPCTSLEYDCADIDRKRLTESEQYELLARIQKTHPVPVSTLDLMVGFHKVLSENKSK